MSRIHEAITKAVTNREAKTSPETNTVEGILSAGYLAARGNGAPVVTNRPAEEAPWVECTHQVWAPDEKRVLLSSESSDAGVREQFRSIRAKLNRLHESQNIRVIAVASAIPGEGKTFVATNLAYALAALRNGSVLLIDSDLRRGSVAELLGARTTPGLAEYMLDEQPLREVIQTGSNSRLYFIANGRRIKEPGEFVGDSKFTGLIQECRKRFDWIIIDTPPVVPFSDATVIASSCDGVLLVLRGGGTPIHLAKRAIKLFNGQTILGAVLNRTAIAEADAKYYNYY